MLGFHFDGRQPLAKIIVQILPDPPLFAFGNLKDFALERGELRIPINVVERPLDDFRHQIKKPGILDQIIARSPPHVIDGDLCVSQSADHQEWHVAAGPGQCIEDPRSLHVRQPHVEKEQARAMFDQPLDGFLAAVQAD